MASLKDIRIRIASVKSTRKITSAMKVVSAAKFHKAQDMEAKFQVYQDKFAYTLGLAISHSADYVHPLMESSNPDAPVAVLVFSSNSSLCGAYNQNVINEAKRVISTLESQGRRVLVHAYGKKVGEALKRDAIALATFDEELVGHPSFEGGVDLYNAVQMAFLRGEYSEVRVIYNKFHNPAFQSPTEQLLLPIKPEIPVSSLAEGAVRVEYIIEPGAKDFFGFALPHLG